LLAAGGFDTALRFYLEDADANLRLGGLAAIVPEAEVHHIRAASARRRSDHAPLTLHEIGASTAVFLRRHAPDEIDAALARLRAGQGRRLIGMLVGGRIAPGDLARLRVTLEAGIANGLVRALPPFAPIADARQAWLGLAGTGLRPGTVLGGWTWKRRRLLNEARRLRALGRIVTVLLLEPGRRPHRQRMTDDGIWLQSGGVHGPAERSEPRIRLWSLSGRLDHEAARIARQRPVHDVRLL
jgi:O-antigen biosynthesis protein